MFGTRTKTKSRKTNVLTADPNAKPVSAALRFHLFPQRQRVFLCSSRVTTRAPANNHSPCRSKVHWRATTEALQRHTSTPQGQFAKTNQEQMKKHNNRHTKSDTASQKTSPQPSWFKSTWHRVDAKYDRKRPTRHQTHRHHVLQIGGHRYCQKLC